MNGGPVLREQRIVRALGELLTKEDKAIAELRARALDLPAMLRRHGLLQVLLFLDAKGGSDHRLAGYLAAGLSAALGEEPSSNAAGDPENLRKRLATMDLPPYLLYQEAALEASSWLKRLVEARTPAEASKPTTETES